MVFRQCRLCLSTEKCLPIFDNSRGDSLAPLALKIAVCVSIHITPKDPYTKFICKKCSVLVDQFYAFREICTNSYMHLVGLDTSKSTDVDELTEVEDEYVVCTVPNIPTSASIKLKLQANSPLADFTDNFEEGQTSETLSKDLEEELNTDSHSRNIPRECIKQTEVHDMESRVKPDDGSESEISYLDYEEIIDPDIEYSSDSNIVSEEVATSVGFDTNPSPEYEVNLLEQDEEDVGNVSEVNNEGSSSVIDDEVHPSGEEVEMDPLGSADEVNASEAGVEVDAEEMAVEVHVSETGVEGDGSEMGVEVDSTEMEDVEYIEDVAFQYSVGGEEADSQSSESKHETNIHVIQLKRSATGASNYVYRFICQKCNLIFETANELRSHQKLCTRELLNREAEQESDEQEVFLAVEDDFDPSSISQYLVLDVGQIKSEPEIEEKKPRAKWGEKRLYSCKLCGKSFRSSSMLHTHERSHTGERPYVCTLCPRSFSQMGALRNHEREHRNDWPYSCDKCSKGFFRPSDLQKHMRTHTNERPFRCGVCSRGFHQQSGLIVHERIHSGERPYQCNICQMTFSQLSNKYRHVKTHAGGLKPFDCKLCHRKFANEDDLVMHRVAHEGGRPRICTYCKKGFRKAYELRDHMRRVHTNERPFTCQLCNRSFFVATDLKNHLLVHTGERPFPCTLCTQTFTQAGNLKRHHQRYHKECVMPEGIEPSNMCVEAMDVDNMNMLQFDTNVE